MSIWDSVPTAPPDAILGLNAAFKSDKNPSKVNLGVGAYRTEEGSPYVLPIVRKMEQQLAADATANHEYIPQDGLQSFVKASARLILGDGAGSIRQNRVASTQALSGTGALRIALAFTHMFVDSNTQVYLPDPTWPNHFNVVAHVGLPPARKYRYYNPKTRAIDLDGLLEDLRNAPSKSVILLHGCCHNPTGCDLSLNEWEKILEVVRMKAHIPLFDCAYQGFGTGSLDTDAAAVRMFERAGIDMMVATSFAKNMGLYGERVGSLHFVLKSPGNVPGVVSQLKKVVRAMYSSPPVHGATVASMILSDPVAFKQWENELVIMSGRIKEMRRLLKTSLDELNTPGTWDHILTQIGMFSFTGLTKDEVEYIRKKYAVYMTSNGRISMAGLNSSNVPYVANAIHDAVTRDINKAML